MNRARAEQEANENMAAIARAVRYHAYIVDSARRFLGDRVLDIGCGIGNTTRLLGRPFTVGIDTADVYLQEFRRRLPHIEARNEDISRSESVARLKAYSFDTIFCSNVLEHIEDDAGCLANAYELLAPNGVLVLIVPNYPRLYGALDEFVRHFRRYERSALRRMVEQVGFSSEASFCINVPGIPWWYLTGKLLRKPVLSDWEPGLIDSMIPLVRLLDTVFLHRIGLSIVQVARKPA